MINIWKTAWKSKGVKIWSIVSAVLLVLLITITLILSQVSLIYGTLNSMFGGEKRVLVEGDPSKYVHYEADYASKNDALAAADRLNEQICEEGVVLLKNDDNALPFGESKKITVFGNNSVNLCYGGSGSSVGSGDNASSVTLYESLSAAGFTCNPVMQKMYRENGLVRPSVSPTMGSILTGYPIFEAPSSSYTAEIRNSYSQYADAALVVLSRIGGEGYDLPRSMFWNGSNYTSWGSDQIIPGARNKDDHYLQLDKNETDMIQEAGTHFEKVIVVINCSTPMELGFLDDKTHYAYNENIKAALWIGNPGNSGINALGRVLNGSVNPSGKTVDLYARNFKKDPTWENFGNNLVANGNRYTLGKDKRNAYFVEYEEGIYTGYRYYETRGYTEAQANNAGWYDENVIYPFGHGLSYSNFDWEIVGNRSKQGETLDENDVIDVDVKVTNRGPLAGKDVVQMYYTSPYDPLGNGKAIEKAHVVLGDFKKTKLLAVGEEEVLTLSIKVRDMASYDYNDANGNGFRGYEAEAGRYEIKVMRDSHTVLETLPYVIENGIQYKIDSATKTVIKNQFDEVSAYIENRGGYMSRKDFEGTWPTTPETSDRSESQSFIESLNYKVSDAETDPWYTNQTPTQSKRVLSYSAAQTKIYQLIGKGYDHPLWDDLLNQLTVDQMRNLIVKGNFNTGFIENIAKPMTIDADGPMGFAIFMNDPSVYNTGYYASECVIGATWNIDLANAMGVMIGNEGLIGNERGDGRPYSGWYAPAMNLHRSQFGGRNFEYFSEDGTLSGKMAVEIIKGAKTKGVYTYAKHFALNEQETSRDANGLITWASEQSMREQYFKPFEMAVKEGGTSAMMSSFNRIGKVWAGGNYDLLTRLLRDEWGFQGMVITDFNLSTYMDLNQMVRAGGDLSLSADKTWSFTASSSSISAVRKATKNILYTVANSNAMNGLGEGIIYRYAMPSWLFWIIIADCAVAGVCLAWGAYIIARSVKKNNNSEILKNNNQ